MAEPMIAIYPPGTAQSDLELLRIRFAELELALLEAFEDLLAAMRKALT